MEVGAVDADQGDRVAIAPKRVRQSGRAGGLFALVFLEELLADTNSWFFTSDFKMEPSCLPVISNLCRLGLEYKPLCLSSSIPLAHQERRAKAVKKIR